MIDKYTEDNLVKWTRLAVAQMFLDVTNSNNENNSFNFNNVKIKFKNPEINIRNAMDDALGKDKNRIVAERDVVENALTKFNKKTMIGHVFTKLINITSEIFDYESFRSESNGSMMGHSATLDPEGNMNDLDKTKCSILSFLNHFIESAISVVASSSFNLSNDVVAKVFDFAQINESNILRGCIKGIISVLSENENLFVSIMNIFWGKFSRCRKDADFRKMSIYVDCISSVQFDFEKKHYREGILRFFSLFIENSKKIEREDLRIKFLDAIRSYSKIIKYSSLSETSKMYIDNTSRIYDVVTSWYQKMKHTEFCLTFLSEWILYTPESFQVKSFLNVLDLISKSCKKANIALFENIASLMSDVTKKVINNEIFHTAVNEIVFPMFFGKKGRRKLTFDGNDVTDVLAEISASILYRDYSSFIPFFIEIFEIRNPDTDIKSIRLIILMSLSLVVEKDPHYFENIYELIESYIRRFFTGSAEKTKEEFRYIANFYTNLIKNFDPPIEIAQSILDAILTKASNIEAGSDFIELFISKCDTDFISKFVIDSLIKLLDKSEELKEPIFIISVQKILSGFSKTSKIKDPTTLKNYLTSFPHRDDYIKIRYRVDSLVFYILSSIKYKYIRTVALKIEYLFANELALFDVYLLSIDNSIATFIDEFYDISKFISHLKSFQRNYPRFCMNLFELVESYWETDKNIYLTCILLSIMDDTTGRHNAFFRSIMALIREEPGYTHIFSFIPASLVLSSLKLISEIKKSDPKEFELYIDCYYYFSQNKDIRDCSSFTSYIYDFLDTVSRYSKSDVLREKIIITMLNIFENFNMSEHVINIKGIDSLIMSYIGNVCERNNVENVSPTLVDCLISISKNLSFDGVENFITFMDFLSKVSRKYDGDKDIQTKTCRIVTNLVLNDSKALRTIFRFSIKSLTPITVTCILSIANNLVSGSFYKRYADGAAIVLCTVIAHISGDSKENRQAVTELLSRVLSFHDEIFTNPLPPEFSLTFSSNNIDRYKKNIKIFADFLRSSVKQATLNEIFRVFSEDIDLCPHLQENVLYILRSLVTNAFTQSSSCFELLLELTSNSNKKSSNVKREIIGLWSAFFIEYSNTSIPIRFIVHKIFEKSVKNMTSFDISTCSCILSIAMQKCPDDISRYLTDIICPYIKALPKSRRGFYEYIDRGRIASHQEEERLLAISAFSQSIVAFETFEQFDQHITPKLPALVFFAILSFHISKYRSAGSMGLLETLFDVYFNKFGKGRRSQHDDMELRRYGIIKEVTSIDHNHFSPDGVKNSIYDNEKVLSLIVNKLAQVDTTIRLRFFEVCLASALHPKSLIEGVEPLHMLKPFCDILDTRRVFQLMLFGIYNLKFDKRDTIPIIIDIISTREILNTTNYFETEFVPVLITFMMLLGIKQKKYENSIYILNAINEILNVGKKLIGKNTSEELVKGIKSVGGEELIIKAMNTFLLSFESLMNDFVLELTSVIDGVVLILEKTKPLTLLSLFSLLIKTSRSFLLSREGNKLDEYIKDVIRKHNSANSKVLMLKYAINLVNVGNFNDVGISELSLRIIDNVFPCVVLDDTTKCVLYYTISFANYTSEPGVRPIALRVLSNFISRHPEISVKGLQSSLKTVTLKYADSNDTIVADKIDCSKYDFLAMNFSTLKAPVQDLLWNYLYELVPDISRDEKDEEFLPIGYKPSDEHLIKRAHKVNTDINVANFNIINLPNKNKSSDWNNPFTDTGRNLHQDLESQEVSPAKKKGVMFNPLVYEPPVPDLNNNSPGQTTVVSKEMSSPDDEEKNKRKMDLRIESNSSKLTANLNKEVFPVGGRYSVERGASFNLSDSYDLPRFRLKPNVSRDENIAEASDLDIDLDFDSSKIVKSKIPINEGKGYELRQPCFKAGAAFVGDDVFPSINEIDFEDTEPLKLSIKSPAPQRDNSRDSITRNVDPIPKSGDKVAIQKKLERLKAHYDRVTEDDYYNIEDKKGVSLKNNYSLKSATREPEKLPNQAKKSVETNETAQKSKFSYQAAGKQTQNLGSNRPQSSSVPKKKTPYDRAGFISPSSKIPVSKARRGESARVSSKVPDSQNKKVNQPLKGRKDVNNTSLRRDNPINNRALADRLNARSSSTRSSYSPRAENGSRASSRVSSPKSNGEYGNGDKSRSSSANSQKSERKPRPTANVRNDDFSRRRYIPSPGRYKPTPSPNFSPNQHRCSKYVPPKNERLYGADSRNYSYKKSSSKLDYSKTAYMNKYNNKRGYRPNNGYSDDIISRRTKGYRGNVSGAEFAAAKNNSSQIIGNEISDTQMYDDNRSSISCLELSFDDDIEFDKQVKKNNKTHKRSQPPPRVPLEEKDKFRNVEVPIIDVVFTLQERDGTRFENVDGSARNGAFSYPLDLNVLGY